MKKLNANGCKIIGSGGYGCVFRPPLKCKGKNRTKKRMVSKLMTLRHVKNEYEEIMKFKKILKKIPNYGKYFLLEDITMCEPDKLSASDLEKFDTKCNALNESYNTYSVNYQLDKLGILNIPDGGSDLKTYIKSLSYSDLPSLNQRLLNLLVYGIIPMNKLKVLHADLKDSNILMNDKHATIIDWGLSAIYKLNAIPEKIQGRSIQYNAPFTSILFNSVFDNMYSTFLNENEIQTYETTREFIEMYVETWFERRGDGHYTAIKQIISSLFVDSNNAASAMDFIVDYLTVVVIKYTTKKKMDILKYFNEVYIHIVDVWGFLTVYLSMLESLAINYDNLTPSEVMLFTKLKTIVLTYIFEPRVVPININQLILDLKELNPIFLQCKNQDASTNFSEYSEVLSIEEPIETALKYKELTIKSTRKKR